MTMQANETSIHEGRQDLIDYLAEHPRAERNDLAGLVDVLVGIWRGKAS